MPKPETRPSCASVHRARAGVVGELADRLGHAEEAAGAAGLAGRELAAAGVVREVAVVGQRARAHERRAFALGAEAEVLELQHDDDRIVVVGLDEVDRLGRRAGLRVEVVAVDAPAAAQQHRVVGEGVVALDRAAHEHVGEAEVARALLAHHQERLGAGARHDAVEQVDRLGDRPRVEVLLDRQRLLEQRVRDCRARWRAGRRRCGRSPRASRRRCACSAAVMKAKIEFGPPEP